MARRDARPGARGLTLQREMAGGDVPGPECAQLRLILGALVLRVVAAKPELDNGGKATTGDWSVSSVMSHEVLEMYIDPNCNLWANDGKGSAYSFEVCDPVEAPSYTVNGVSVSNFVTPSWFDSLAPATAQFDIVLSPDGGPVVGAECFDDLNCSRPTRPS